jgi:hypothetical protein
MVGVTTTGAVGAGTSAVIARAVVITLVILVSGGNLWWISFPLIPFIRKDKRCVGCIGVFPVGWIYSTEWMMGGFW